MRNRSPNLVLNGKKWPYRCVYWMRADDPTESLGRFGLFKPHGRWSIHGEIIDEQEQSVIYFQRLGDLFRFKMLVLA